MDEALRVDQLGVGVAPVAEHLPGGAHQDLADAVAVGPLDAQLDDRERPAGRARVLGHQPPRRRRHRPAGLGHAIDRRDPLVGVGERLAQPADELGGDRRAAERDGAHAAEVAPGQ